MKTEHLVKHAAFVGAIVVVFYAACLLWRFTMTDPLVMQFHLLALKSTFPGFKGYDAASVAWGGIVSFAYGFIFSFIFHSLHRNCACGMKK